MGKVTGIGGIFFKTRDPESLLAWYGEHLGIEMDDHGSWSFLRRDDTDPDQQGRTVWAPFPEDTDYFSLRRAGIEVDDRVEDYDYGRFGWIMDPEGNRIELWEPPA